MLYVPPIILKLPWVDLANFTIFHQRRRSALFDSIPIIEQNAEFVGVHIRPISSFSLEISKQNNEQNMTLVQCRHGRYFTKDVIGQIESLI